MLLLFFLSIITIITILNLKAYDGAAAYELGKARIVSLVICLMFWLLSFAMAWLLVHFGLYGLAVVSVMYMNGAAGSVMKTLTETELHVDEAAHQVCLCA
jgi:hypothetical protein